MPGDELVGLERTVTAGGGWNAETVGAYVRQLWASPAHRGGDELLLVLTLRFNRLHHRFADRSTGQSVSTSGRTTQPNANNNSDTANRNVSLADGIASGCNVASNTTSTTEMVVS